MRRTLLRAATFLALAFIGATQGAAGQTQPADPPHEYQVKGAFLFNFAKFVNWPPQAFSDAASPIVIGVLGEDPFGAMLDDLVRDERVNGRDIAVRRLRPGDEPGGCHILFISGSERRRLPEILVGIGNGSVLTVGDMAGFTTTGGMIQLTKDDFRIGLEVNLQAAERAQLRISSRLLSLARIVDAPAAAGGIDP